MTYKIEFPTKHINNLDDKTICIMIPDGFVWIPWKKRNGEIITTLTNTEVNGIHMTVIKIPEWLYNRERDNLRQIKDVLIECWRSDAFRVESLTYTNRK